MPEPVRVAIPGVGLVEFPDSMTADEMSVAAAQLHQQFLDTRAHNLTQQAGATGDHPDTSTALSLAGAGAGVPIAARGMLDFATSPTAAKTLGSVARGLTTTGGVIHGLYRGNPSEVIAAPISGWAAGKGGYFLGRNLQDVAKPIAGLLEKATPYASTFTQLAGAQGINDLAQMAEPSRKDIGFLGIGPSPTEIPPAPEMTPEQRAAYEQTWQGKLGRLIGRLRQ